MDKGAGIASAVTDKGAGIAFTRDTGSEGAGWVEHLGGVTEIPSSSKTLRALGYLVRNELNKLSKVCYAPSWLRTYTIQLESGWFGFRGLGVT